MSGDNQKKADRRDFLKITGSAIAGAAIGVVSTKVADNIHHGTAASQGTENLSSDTLSSSLYPKEKRNRLSNQNSNLKDEYKVLVIGSGYGASIMAARIGEKMTELGLQKGDVCMLERGMERQPGEFPDKFKLFDFSKDPQNAAKHLRTKTNPLGMYDVHATGDSDVVVANGLGGTSNINANVALEPLENIFNGYPDRWPKDITFNTIQPYFKKVREMLATEKWDEGKLGELAKVKFMKDCQKTIAEQIQKNTPEENKVKHYYLDLAVNLTKYDGVENQHGVYQNACNSCGDCVTGCNVGAKNTLIMNYLPHAKRNGVEIYTQVEVESINPINDGKDGYNVNVKIYNQPHPTVYGNNDEGSEEENKKITRRTLRAKNVIVGAGTLGTFKILKRSVDKYGLALSDKLGSHYSDNGDVLGTCYNSDRRTDSMGYGVNNNSGRKVGPTIVSILDMRQDPQRQFLIEDGAFPSAITDILRHSFARAGRLLTFGKRANPASEDRINKDTQMGGDFNNDGAVNHSMCYLAMGRDSANGQLSYNEDSDTVRMTWQGRTNLGEENTYVKAKKVFALMSETTGGINFENPRTSIEVLDFKREKDNSLVHKGGVPVSVHALGGCCVADDITRGVVNSKGQVFKKGGSNEVYPGLYVADGSVIPVAIEANPFLTISALSEHFAAQMKKEDLNS